MGCRTDAGIANGISRSRQEPFLHPANYLPKLGVAIFLEMTSLKGVSSMEVHRDLGISQETAWHLLHRIHKGWFPEILQVFERPVEVYKSYISGRELNETRARNSMREGNGRQIYCTRCKGSENQTHLCLGSRRYREASNARLYQ